MKKNLSFFSLMVLLFACTDDAQPVKSNITIKTKIEVIDGRLKFDNVEELTAVLMEVQNVPDNATNGRLLGLPYSSYYNAVKSNKFSAPTDLGALTQLDYQIVLNENQEIQVGQFIYHIGNKESKKYSLKGELLEVEKIEVAYLNESNNAFEKEPATARQFDEWYVQSVPLKIPLASIYAGNKFFRVTSFFIQRYYFRVQLKSMDIAWETDLTDVKAEYWEYFGTSCDCQFEPSGNFPRYTYDKAQVTVATGAATNSYYNNVGIILVGAFNVKPYNGPYSVIDGIFSR
jgi:hypothetical protein